MINLADYRKYWESLAETVGVSNALAITIDKEMAKKLQAIKRGEMVLFWLPPASRSEGAGIDAYKEENSCVLFVMAKYDPLRESSLDCLEATQLTMELVKARLIADAGCPCSKIKAEINSIDTMPETDFYGSFAGWSIGFKIITN